MIRLSKQSLKNNFIFQFAYQIIVLVVPLVISPYLTRILGDTSLGKFTFVNSIASYFVLLANLGIAKYGQRLIAKNSKNEDDLRKAFWSLFTVHAIFSMLCLAIYLVVFSFFHFEDQVLYLVETIFVASALFDITWLFYGLENFKGVVIRNAIIKVLECISIFLLVKKESDILVYTIISASTILLGQLIMIPQAILSVRPIGFHFSDCKVHIKPLLLFSVSVFAVTLYTVFDKTLLGLMSTKENVAYYEYANKIIALPRTFTTIIGAVLFPRACRMVSDGDQKGQLDYVKISLLFVSFVGMASAFGLLAISKQFAIYYYGKQFAESGNVMMALCLLPFIIGLGDIMRMVFLIPHGMDKEYTICIVLNAVINLILSFLLIPLLGLYGAVIGTLSAELFGCIVQIILCRKFFNISLVIKSSIPFFIIGFFMYKIVIIVGEHLNKNDFLSIVFQIGIGAIVYLLLSFMFVIFFEKKIISKYKN